MQAPELAVEEMERCVRELGFPGVQIGSHINTWDLNDPELFPVYTVSTAAFAQPTFAQPTRSGTALAWQTPCWWGTKKGSFSGGEGPQEASDFRCR